MISLGLLPITYISLYLGADSHITQIKRISHFIRFFFSCCFILKLGFIVRNVYLLTAKLVKARQ